MRIIVTGVSILDAKVAEVFKFKMELKNIMKNPFEKPPGRPENPSIWKCPHCGGSGKNRDGKPCKPCNGTGKKTDN